jgi:hypothetical protein
VLDKTYYFCSEECMNQFAGSSTGSSSHDAGADPHAVLKDPLSDRSVATLTLITAISTDGINRMENRVVIRHHAKKLSHWF